MKSKNIVSFIFIILFPLSLPAAGPGSDECFNCHSSIGDELQKPADLYKNDIHYSKGISCAQCHGGDSSTDDMELSMSKTSGFRGVPERKDRITDCISCHSDENKMRSMGFSGSVDQYEKLKVSVHFKSTYNNEGPIADCITCHGVHNISKAASADSPVYPTKITALCGSCHSSAAYMKNYNPGLPVDQAAKYKTSIHGEKNSMGDINAAECSDCHGSHEIREAEDPRSFVYPTNIPKVCSNCHSDDTKMAAYKIPSDQYENYINSVHGKALLEKGDLSAPSCNDCHGNHGAVLPAAASISKVCGSCHTLNMEMFEMSPHKQAFELSGIPECESCHGNHNIAAATDELTGTGENASCISCHSEGDKGYFTAAKMKSLIDSLKLEEVKAVKILEQANQKGMDVSDASFSLKSIRQILIHSRTMLHSFDEKKFDEAIKPGFEITSSAKIDGQSAVDNYYFRRKGLAVSTLIVTLLVIGLYIKIRRIEKDYK